MAITWIPNFRSLPSFDNYQLVGSTLPVRLAWQFQADDVIRDPPIVGEDGTIYVEAGPYIYALSQENGQIKWQHQTRQRIEGFILPYADLVLITTVEDSVLQALRARDGNLVWEVSLAEFVQTQSPFGRPSVTHLLSDSGHIYIGVSLNRGTQILAFEPTTGHLLWQAPPELPARRTPPYAIFAGQEGIIIVDSNLIILDKETGHILRWEDTFIESYNPPIYYAGMLYTSGEVVRVIDIHTLQKRWDFTDECPGYWDQVPYPPEIIDEIAYILPTCYLVYALDASNGQLLWRYEDGNRQAVESFVVFQGVGYLLTADATLHTLDLNTGQELGRMEAEPQWVQAASQHLVASEILLLRYGNDQLFVFRPVTSSDGN